MLKPVVQPVRPAKLPLVKVKPRIRRRNKHSTWSKDKLKKMASGEIETPKFAFEPAPAEKSTPKYDDVASIAPPMLLVFTYPPGVTVEMDGKVVGATPVIRMLPEDTKGVTVKLSAIGFKSHVETLSGNKDRQYRVGVAMMPLPDNK